jgi:hypothetical protein
MSFANGSSNTQFSGYAWGNGMVTGHANTTANALAPASPQHRWLELGLLQRGYSPWLAVDS